ncbi:DUF438 domain-containing protein [Collinsella sp. AGMB00827]|uniref:DUF438 domain-containing protein n=1 Tax=Collinsella ureilytica TaxID=2869515 RepID=A0ABS7MKP1_9ACTN|nr:DUF438 domain-containing protein [Collinsella urealyticum]MBY4797937.1 DUF438 domain-containing protein [Collinsella urealyticum]
MNRPDENNTLTDTVATLASMLKRLGAGADFETISHEFRQRFASVSAREISDAEQALIASGVPIEEIQRLCDVHATLFEGSISCAIPNDHPEQQAGHPVRIMRDENKEIGKRAEAAKAAAKKAKHLLEREDFPAAQAVLADAADQLSLSFVHYKRKEELLFPHLERHNITGPSTVMWGKDDEVRAAVARVFELIGNADEASIPAPQALSLAIDALSEAAAGALSMIDKEEHVLIPLALETLSATAWTQIADESPEFGFAYIANPPHWKADGLSLAEERIRENMQARSQTSQVPGGLTDRSNDVRSMPETPSASACGCSKGTEADISPVASSTQVLRTHQSSTASTATMSTNNVDIEHDRTPERIELSTGSFTVAELEAVLNTIPLDITFVDAKDTTQYFSHGDTRAFPRPKSCLGRNIYACHPPKSQAMVRHVMESFKRGDEDSFAFWIHKANRFLYIRYFAVRDQDGTYLGALETTQDITEIQALEGENRRGADMRRERAEQDQQAHPQA